MLSQEEMLKTWVSDPDVSLKDMYLLAAENGYTDYVVERRETLMAYVHANIRRNMKVVPLLESIENNRWADFYAFDVTSCSNLPAKPIYTKEELAEALGGMKCVS